MAIKYNPPKLNLAIIKYQLNIRIRHFKIIIYTIHDISIPFDLDYLNFNENTSRVIGDIMTTIKLH